MARYTGPKNKLSRQEGKDLFGTGGPSLARRLNQPPGMHGRALRKRQTEYGRQLCEKQKVKRIYGLTERQFRRFFRILFACSGEQTGSATVTRTPDPAMTVVQPNYEPLPPTAYEALRDLMAAALYRRWSHRNYKRLLAK